MAAALKFATSKAQAARRMECEGVMLLISHCTQTPCASDYLATAIAERSFTLIDNALSDTVKATSAYQINLASIQTNSSLEFCWTLTGLSLRPQ